MIVLAATYTLGAERFACSSEGRLTESVVEQAANRSSSRPKVSYVVSYKVDDVTRSVVGYYQPAPSMQPNWGERERELAQSWIEKHPVGSGMDVVHHCAFPGIAAVKSDNWDSSIRWILFVYLAVLVIFSTVIWLVSTVLFKWSAPFLVGKRIPKGRHP